MPIVSLDIPAGVAAEIRVIAETAGFGNDAEAGKRFIISLIRHALATRKRAVAQESFDTLISVAEEEARALAAAIT